MNKKGLAKVYSRIILISFILFVLFLGTYNQPYYPTTWIDEGFVLQGAMNLARYGKYAMLSSEGFRVLDQPLIANGPGVVLPIFVVYKLFGIGLIQARLVMILFMIGTIFVFYSTANKLYGYTAALISIFFFIALPEQGFLYLGRQALGMIPSLLYFFIGYLFWVRSLERDSLVPLTGAGIFFGLAAITKGQYMLILPIFGVVAFLDLIYYRTNSFRKIALLLAFTSGVIAVWYGVQFILLGRDNLLQNFQAVSSSAQVSVTALRPMRIPTNIWYLIRSGHLIIVPGFLYYCWISRKRDISSLFHVPFLVFIAGWLSWYAFVSIGWQRYAFDPYVIGTLLTGKLIADIFLLLQGKDSALNALPTHQPAARYVLSLLVFFLLAVCFFGVYNQWKLISAEPDRSPQQLAAYIRENISSSGVIESAEWEIDPLAPNHIYHHPENYWVDMMTQAMHFGTEPGEVYDPSVYNPDFLIDGLFSKWTNLYEDYLSKGCCILLESINYYDIYTVID
jgi:hypothetical protein